jgi:hypothetical protein
VIAALETISSDSVLPIAAATPQLAGASAVGGFAAKLAAAQGSATASAPVSDDTANTAGSVSGKVSAAASKWSVPRTQSAQSKNSAPGNVAASAGNSLATPVVTSTIMPATMPLVQTTTQGNGDLSEARSHSIGEPIAAASASHAVASDEISAPNTIARSSIAPVASSSSINPRQSFDATLSSNAATGDRAETVNTPGTGQHGVAYSQAQSQVESSDPQPPLPSSASAASSPAAAQQFASDTSPTETVDVSESSLPGSLALLNPDTQIAQMDAPNFAVPAFTPAAVPGFAASSFRDPANLAESGNATAEVARLQRGETNLAFVDSASALPGSDAASRLASVQSAVAPMNSAAAKPSVRSGSAKTSIEASSPNLRSASATSTSVAAATANTNGSSKLGTQTPFDVFFSGSGAGAGSAAAVLPKMILPASGAVLHNNLANATSAGTTTSQNGSSNSASQASIPANKNAGSIGKVANAQGAMSASGSADPSAGDTTNIGLDGTVRSDSASSASTASAASPLPSSPPDPSASLPVAAAIASTGAQTTPADLPAKSPLPSAASNPANAAPAVPQTQLLANPVQLAQMANRAGQSEMRIGLNTAAFGSVEVRTVVRSGDVGLTIGSEKGDLHGLLSNEMPALTSNLQQQNLRLNNVSFTQGSGFSNGSNGSNNMTGGGSQQQGSSTPQPAPPSFQTSWNNEDFAAEAPEVPAQPFSYDGGSLSILA